MQCPECGNNELQQHHRFCCQCGCRLDKKGAESSINGSFDLATSPKDDKNLKEDRAGGVCPGEESCSPGDSGANFITQENTSSVGQTHLSDQVVVVPSQKGETEEDRNVLLYDKYHSESATASYLQSHASQGVAEPAEKGNGTSLCAGDGNGAERHGLCNVEATQYGNIKNGTAYSVESENCTTQPVNDGKGIVLPVVGEEHGDDGSDQRDKRVERKAEQCVEDQGTGASVCSKKGIVQSAKDKIENGQSGVHEGVEHSGENKEGIGQYGKDKEGAKDSGKEKKRSAQYEGDKESTGQSGKDREGVRKSEEDKECIGHSGEDKESTGHSKDTEGNRASVAGLEGSVHSAEVKKDTERSGEDKEGVRDFGENKEGMEQYGKDKEGAKYSGNDNECTGQSIRDKKNTGRSDEDKEDAQDSGKGKGCTGQSYDNKQVIGGFGDEDEHTKLSGEDKKGTEQSEKDKKDTEQLDGDKKGTRKCDENLHGGGQSGERQKNTEDYLSVIFHALMTPTFQIFPDRDKVYLRCGLFSWKAEKQIEIHPVRKWYGDYLEVEGTVRITLRQASEGVSYKYVVAKKEDWKPHWECLIGFKSTSGRHVNRYLAVPEDYRQNNGVWHQYDDAVFGEPGFLASMCSHFSLLRHFVQDPAEGRRRAMLAMLPPLENCSLEEVEKTGSAILKKINNVVYCMSKALLEDGNKIYSRIPQGFNAQWVLLEYIAHQLRLNIEVAQTGDDKAQAKRLATSVIIACAAVHHQLTSLTDDELRSLLESLALPVTPGQKTCSEYDALLKHFPKSKQTVANSLLELCLFTIESRPGIYHWLYVVPLLHFFSNTSAPFSRTMLPASPGLTDSCWWGSQGLDLQLVRQQASNSRWSPTLLIQSLTSMFELDPLLKRTFLLALPIFDIAKIIPREMFSWYEVCWTLERVVRERKNPHLLDEEWKSLEVCISEMAERIGRYKICNDPWQEPFSQGEEMISLGRAVTQLLKDLVKLDSPLVKEKSSLVFDTISLLRQSLVLAKRCLQSNEKVSKSSKENGNDVTKEIFNDALMSLRDSLEKAFTGSLCTESRRHEEFQVWSDLLSVKCEEEELQQVWDRSMKDNLNSRVNQLSHENVVELYCTLDLGNYCQEIEECLMSRSFQAVEHFAQGGMKDDQLASLSSGFNRSALTRDKAARVSKLFARILERFWPRSNDGGEPSQYDILQHILSWKPMDYYFKHFGEQSLLRENLPPEGQTLLFMASSLLGDVFRQIKHGEITVQGLRLVHEYRDRFLELCFLISEEEGTRSDYHLEEEEGKKEARAKVYLDLRMEELEAFEEERETVYSFLDMISLLNSVETAVSEIQERANMDVSFHPMVEICHKRSAADEPIVKFFAISPKEKRMLQQLHRVQSSVIFRDLWQKCGSRAAELYKEDKGNGRLSVQQVQEMVWMPSFNRWRELWERVISGDIYLKDVDLQFKKFQGDPESFELEFMPVSQFFGDEENLDDVLSRRKTQIKRCQNVRECVEAAECIWKFKEAMGMHGDFKVVNDFRNQMDSEFQRRTLGSIDEEFLETSRGLESLTKPRMDCLTAVIACKEYISWLKDEVKGREEVKTLVDLAMMSAGESDMETDRVSFLHTTALGFAPFVFDLRDDFGFTELMETCEKVWEELDRDETLPKKLEGISRHLEWLKGIKDAHAMSSLKLAQAINDRGVYRIGQLSNAAHCQPDDDKTLDSVVTLLLPSINREGNGKTYSLEELKDLQSKLVLIAGKRSSGQEDVDRFVEILQGVTRLGQALVGLCKIGDVSHLDWAEEFRCRSIAGKSVTEELTKQSELLEKCYEACRENNAFLRRKYHELNYYTTQQLLFLRKELGALRNSVTLDTLGLPVYALLDKMHPEIHPSSLRDALIEAGLMVQVDGDVSNDSTRNEVAVSGHRVEEDRYSPLNEADQVSEKYETLLDSVEKLGYSERLAVAAVVAGWEKSVADLIVWCVQNNANDDLVEQLNESATKDPKFRKIVPQSEETASSKSSLDSDEDNMSSTDEDENAIFPEETTLDQTNGGSYLSLEELGVILSRIASLGEGRILTRQIPTSYLKRGKPNLILAPKDDIFAAVLGLYKDDGRQPLPSSEEVLICSSETSAEEVELLFRRALADTGERLYCLVNGDLLDYNVSQRAVDCLHTLMQDYQENEAFALVILCSKENEDRALLVASMDQFRVAGMPRFPRPEEIRLYLQQQFQTPGQRSGVYRERHVIWSAAAEVDGAKMLTTRVVTSARAGVGKSLVVKRLTDQVSYLANNLVMVEMLKSENQEQPLCVTIPIHDKHSRISDVMSFLLPHALRSDVPLSRIFHLDVTSTVTSELETLLFNLLILGELRDDRGRVWRRNPFDLYIVEITDANDPGNSKNRRNQFQEESRNFKLHQLLPATRCISPKRTLRVLHRKTMGQAATNPLFDDQEFRSEEVQRVSQYLRLHEYEPELIQEFSFDHDVNFDSQEECLEILMRNCGVNDPSWMELRHFVNFLNSQLRDSEWSPFCSMENVGDTLEGFRMFVVAFMIHMSRDFATRSLKEGAFSVKTITGEDEEEDIKHLQLKRHWEGSPHPYIFFNWPERETFTFLGFRIDLDGNLIDSESEEVIQENLISRRLRTGLHVQNVKLDKDFESYTKIEKIEVLCSVMGVPWVSDPDESYELTGDNVKKILAIHMRFRCNIPVVIMGETGCGKTRLIRYMCGLQSGVIGGCKNMLLVKIHGGTTYKDIERNVCQAEEMALENEQQNVDTVLFFDEANTTEALGMIKEIMVDRRCNGRPLNPGSNRLQFIVACNPYRRHTDEMIKKLESAGLGYHVKVDETAERLGRIPLRHLVYRVHELPESMRSLVWDFGQLKPEIEESYTRQIVRRHVCREGRFGGQRSDEENEQLVNAIASVLAASQQFMREKKDECSFVSLRDVKRAMEAMVWFYKNHAIFASLMSKADGREEEQGNDDKEDDDDDDDDDDDNDDDDDEEDEEEEEDEATKQATEKQTFVRRFLEDVKRPFSFANEGNATPITIDTTPAEYFFTDVKHLTHDQDIREDVDIDPVTWSLILALGVCYQARLQERDEYRKMVASVFRAPCNLPGGAERIEEEISRCQQAVLKELELGPNIAQNMALTENVFMMVVCIELRIPLFVVGKPGSSKSLAKTVVADNMQGQASRSELFKSFKQIQLVSYQCSPQSTPKGIEDTFHQCSELQRNKNTDKITGRVTDKFASVVVLDEVGLAEDSPKMPLKTLHSLLEDDENLDDDVIKTEDKAPRVAFIGLSNWALDPAKMNRGIMLCRNEPDEDELEHTARGIFGNDERTLPFVEPLIPPLVRGYTELYNKQKNLKTLQEGKKDEFFGLRDFYSLVKMIFHIAKAKKRKPEWQEIEHAIRRNFSGLLVDDFRPVDILIQHLGFPLDYLQNQQDREGFGPLHLIRASLNQHDHEGESRYLLILTENFAALPVVKQLLHEIDSEEPYVIFGSSFPNDQLFTQVCRNINRIKICMETGRTVVLLNLENLYESLYDALNQYYVYFGGEKYVDLGLGNHRVKCRVHKNFRLIVIAEKEVVYNKFPIPLINRLEKHFLVMSTSLTEPQKQLTEKLRTWVEDFATVFHKAHEKRRRTFTPGDAFVGYHEDSAPAVVLQVCNEFCKKGTSIGEEGSEPWQAKVMRTCEKRLLQCATPDSVSRLYSTRLAGHASELTHLYFYEQEHSSLPNFLCSVLKANEAAVNTDRSRASVRAQITTHSRLLSDRDLPVIAEAADLSENSVKCVTLQQFQTEQQFCNCVGEFFAKRGGRESLFIVQCDSSDQTLRLIPCARHLLLEECRKTEEELDEICTSTSHILMVVQLGRVAGGTPNFVGVQGEGWLSAHIDDLCPAVEDVPSVEALTNRSISEIFRSALNKSEKSLNVNKLLISCVQAAACRIEDDAALLNRATRRIEILLQLLSSETQDRHGDVACFATVLAERVYQLLLQKDMRTPEQGRKWLELEALSGSRVQETGTFKKALWRRFQTVVAPILAEVIAYIDRDGNLELADGKEIWLLDLWLVIFQKRSESDLYYEAFLVQEGEKEVARSRVPVSKSGFRSHAFECKFPFSWLIKEQVDDLFREARSIAANSRENVTECLRKLIANSEVDQVVLAKVKREDQLDSLVTRYLHDYIHMVYLPLGPEELEVVERAITVAAKEIHQTQPAEFVMDLALVHTAYFHIQQQLVFLFQLVRAEPDIVQDLLQNFTVDEREVTVDAVALQMCLERLEPRSEDIEDSSRRQHWCDKVLSVRTPLEAMLAKRSLLGEREEIPVAREKRKVILTECRHMWQRLSAARMFIEHVCPSKTTPSNEEFHQVLSLVKALGEKTDFSKAESLKVVERFLVNCSEESAERLHADKPEEQTEFLHRCNSFFMELVSVFCFGDSARELDSEVFEMLMHYVTGTRFTQTKQFSPFSEFGADSSPVVRSFLLQQLLRSSDKTAKHHLERFLFEAQGLSSEVPHLLQVCLLAVQCMENSWASDFATKALDLSVRVGIVTKLCADALKCLEDDDTTSDDFKVASLDAVATLRYALSVAAEFLYMRCITDEEPWISDATRSCLSPLFDTIKAVCTSSISRGPAMFLLKQLVKRYGCHSIGTVKQYERFSWIIPAEFQGMHRDDQATADRFLVYDKCYRELRDSLATALLSENADHFLASLEEKEHMPRHVNDIMLVLALYREVTVPLGIGGEQQLRPGARTLLKDAVLNSHRRLSVPARPLATAVLENSQGLGFPRLTVQETQGKEERALAEVVVHVSAVVHCAHFDVLLEPLRMLLLSPQHMLNAFLPTMPEDSFYEAEAAILAVERGMWYECPAGHRYFIGDCGRPDQQRDCPECQVPVEIGGQAHKPAVGNRRTTREDRSNKGHVLGSPQKVVSERDLSPAIVSLLRAILHSVMIAGGCQQPEIMSQLIQPEVPMEATCDFLWDHLRNDVKSMSLSLERSVDEVLLAIHLVLSEIVYRANEREQEFCIACDWTTKSGRRKWENEFLKTFISPVVENLEERLQHFFALSVDDRRLGSDPLMREVYEVNDPPIPRTPSDVHLGHGAFWRYRPRVTVEHVIRQHQEVKRTLTGCKILTKFFAEEQKLRALRYLPDVVALQKTVADRFHRRIDREKAGRLKIDDFLKDLARGQKDNISKLFQSFRSAWELVRPHLQSQGRFVPTSELCSKSIDKRCHLSLLLPTEEGPGLCCMGMLFFLVNTHNELVQAYHSEINAEASARTTDRIPLSEVSLSHLIAYDPERDLLPLVLSNCSYTLEVGKETLLQYNWEALERQLINRFIRGRAVVDFAAEQFTFTFLEDVRDDRNFSSLKAKIPQERLQGVIRTQILSELSLSDISDVLSTLDIAIGFLCLAGGNPDMEVSTYLRTVLHLSKEESSLKSKKAQQHCCLSHILDLWRTLTVGRAQLLFKNGQDPFDQVRDCFKTEMPQSLTRQFSAALKKIDVEFFISTVVEIINLRLHQEDDQTGEMSLSEYISMYLDDNGDEGVSEFRGIPEDVRVKHVIHALEVTLEISELDKGRRRSMLT